MVIGSTFCRSTRTCVRLGSPLRALSARNEMREERQQPLPEKHSDEPDES